jgi:ABC-type transport system involved in cytochrome c biogenesis permease subunit
MVVKTDLVGYLIYCALAAHVYAAAAMVLRRRMFGEVAFVTGFAACAGAFVARWVAVAHVPLEGMFEVFLALGMLVWPLSLLVRRALGAEGAAAHALLGAAVLFPAGFVFPAAARELPALLRSGWFLPHVGAYLLGYVVMLMAAVQAALQLGSRAGTALAAARERTTWRLARVGFPLLTIGLVVGAAWGKRAWGDWWHFDPKELWALVTWLVFAGYFHLRAALDGRRLRLCSAAVLVGAGAIGMTLLWVNLTASSALHTHGL